VELNKVLQSAKDWIVLKSENAQLSDDFEDRIGKYVLNPGTLHYLDLSKSDDTTFVKNADTEKEGFVALFSKTAISLREFGFDRVAHTKSFEDIVAAWQPKKIVELSSRIDEAGKSLRINKDERYAIWGTGSAGGLAVDVITRSGGKIVFAVDKAEARQGYDFYGLTIQAPEALAGREDEYDILIAANFTRFPEIKQEALALGVPEEKIQYITSLMETHEGGFC